MPTDVSNALGTARQFTPRPDSLYQGRYGGLSVQQATADISKSAELAENMNKLNAVVQGYLVQHEKYLDTRGQIEAENLINGLSADDIKKLSVVDAAQASGIVSSMDNPYFLAHAEKLRGTFLARQMKLDYDNEYAMNPSASLKEEQERFANYANKYKDNLFKSNSRPQNIAAFDMGFNENQLVNYTNLATDWNKKKYQDDITVTMASTQSKLGDIIQNSPELLKVNGAMTQAVQEAFNETRLMGLPMSYRMKLLDDFATQIIQTGHLDGTRLEQMLDNVVVQTGIDGTKTVASSLLDMQTYKTYAAKFNEQFMTKQKEDAINSYVNKGKAGMDAYLADLEKMRIEDPDNAPAFANLYPQIKNGINQKEAERKAIAREKLKAQLEAQKEAKKSNDLRGAVVTWCNKGTFYNGMSISTIKMDKEELSMVALPLLQQFQEQGDFDKVTRLMSMPQMSAIRNDIAADITYKLDSILPASDGTVNVDSSTLALLQFYTNNPNSVEHMFGSEVAKRARMLNSLFTLHNGDMSLTLQDFATYNSADPDVKNGHAEQVRKLIANTGYTAEGVLHLSEDDNFDTISVPIASNPSLESAVTDLATIFCIQGLSTWDALNKAGYVISNNFATYHNAVFPKGVAMDIAYGMSEEQSEIYFRRGLADCIYELTETNGADVDVAYDRATQVFTFTDNLTYKRITRDLSYVRQKSLDRWNKDMEWYDSQQTSGDSSYTIDDINNERETSGSYTSNMYGTGLRSVF